MMKWKFEFEAKSSDLSIRTRSFISTEKKMAYRSMYKIILAVVKSY